MRSCLISLLFIALSGCGGGDSSDTVPTGTLELTVIDGASATPISGARIIVIDGGTGESIDLLSSDASGNASEVYETGALQLRVSTQGYSQSPPPGIPPLPVQIVQDQTTSITVRLYALAAGERGLISGQVTDNRGLPAVAALIVAEAEDGTLLSTISGPNGGYILNNVPTGSATLSAFLGGNNFPVTDLVSVIADTETTQDIAAVSTATGEISGHVSFSAISGDIIDITLLHPGTRDPLPGLRTLTNAGGDYVLTGVPNGDFEIIASLENDGFVLDPDESVTQGVPVVQITEAVPVMTRGFKVTGSVQLTSPDSTTDASIPELSSIPTFTWVKASSYASADFFVVEVVDESGESIWGGFDSANNFMPLVTIAQGNEPSVGYNSDGTATLAVLEEGRHYQFRVYAAVTDANEIRGYRLLSSGETLDGIFRVTM